MPCHTIQRNEKKGSSHFEVVTQYETSGGFQCCRNLVQVQEKIFWGIYTKKLFPHFYNVNHIQQMESTILNRYRNNTNQYNLSKAVKNTKK